MSFTKFFELTSNKVDWLNLTNRIYKTVNSSIQLSPQELVIVLDIPYYKGVTQLLEKTPNRVIANYLGWMIAMSLGDYTVEKFRKIEFEFQKVNSGVEQQTELWRICATYLQNVLPYAVGRKYVDENFTKKDKEEVRNIFQLITKH
jgi:predicted metalloendopeptidase